MGDVLSLEPLVSRLHAGGHEVTVCAQPAWRPLLPPAAVATWVDARVPWAARRLSAKYAFGAYLSTEFRSFVRELSTPQRATVGLDTRGDVRSVLLLYLAGCRKVYTLSHYLGTDMPVFPGAAERVLRVPSFPRWRQNLEFAAPLGLAPVWERPPRLDHLAVSRSAVQGRVGCIPVATWQGKSWLDARWRQLADRMRNAGLDVRGLCGPGQKEPAARALGPESAVVECASVGEWTAELSRLSALVTVNTGPMHVAAALGVPLVALEGSSALPLWAPPGARSFVVHHQDQLGCAPCHQTDRPLPCGCKCMALISADEVWDAVQGLITGAAGT